jgi:hypothetical protein
MYFVEFIMPSSGSRLPGSTAMKNTENIFWKVFYGLLMTLRSHWFITASSDTLAL